MWNEQDEQTPGDWAALVTSELSSWIASLGGKGGLSRGFFELIKNIGEAKSKSEETRIIKEEMVKLKAILADPKTAGKKRRQKEALIRLIYCEMLGHDVSSFGYIPCVNMTADSNLICKRIGYLACSLFLHPEHEYLLLLVNSWRRDLTSQNYIEVAAALSTIAKLVNTDTIPAIQDLVVKLIDHPQDMVRKKAVMVMHRFWQIKPRMLPELQPKLKKSLYDAHPSVMGAALCFYHDLVAESPGSYKEAIPSFVSILKQVSERALPSSYEYRRIPSPWLQIRLLRTLAVLGRDDQRASEHMYEVVHQTMKRADVGINAGFAVVYECIRSITVIYPNNVLLDAAAACISRFMAQQNHNLKYMGIKALTMMVRISPKYAAEHQLMVLDCLEDRDDTLRRKTLQLLYEMTNPANVETVTAKLLQHLRRATDPYLRREIVTRAAANAEKFAPSTEWYIETMNAMFLLGGEYVPREMAFNLMGLLAEGTGSDESPESLEQDDDLRAFAVDTFMDTLRDNPVLPELQMQVVAWVLGEYGYLSEIGVAAIVDALLDLAERPSAAKSDARSWVVAALCKLVAQMRREANDNDNSGSGGGGGGEEGFRVPSGVVELMERNVHSQSLDLQQCCREGLALLATPQLMDAVLPLDAKMDIIDVDVELPFLDAFVELALANGAEDYDPPARKSLYPVQASEFSDIIETRTLRFTAYEAPSLPRPAERRAIFAPPPDPAAQAQPAQTEYAQPSATSSSSSERLPAPAPAPEPTASSHAWGAPVSRSATGAGGGWAPPVARLEPPPQPQLVVVEQPQPPPPQQQQHTVHETQPVAQVHQPDVVVEPVSDPAADRRRARRAGVRATRLAQRTAAELPGTSDLPPTTTEPTQTQTLVGVEQPPEPAQPPPPSLPAATTTAAEPVVTTSEPPPQPQPEAAPEPVAVPSPVLPVGDLLSLDAPTPEPKQATAISADLLGLDSWL